MLDKKFALYQESGDGNKNYAVQIKTIALDIAKQFGVRGRADTLRLELPSRPTLHGEGFTSNP
jgi:hypothetical protein